MLRSMRAASSQETLSPILKTSQSTWWKQRVKALGRDMQHGSDDRTCVMPLEQNT
jgi:hypothetical protein